MVHEEFEFCFRWEVLQVGDAFVVVCKFGSCAFDFVRGAVVDVKSAAFAYVVGDDDGDRGCGSSGVANGPCEVHADVFAASVESFFDFDVDDAVKG